MDYKTKLKKIFNSHGASEQLKKLSEEVFELQEAIIKFNYEELHEGTPKYVYLKGKMEAEFADVLVLLCQFRLNYDLDWDYIKKVIRYKIDRQCERDSING